MPYKKILIYYVLVLLKALVDIKEHIFIVFQKKYLTAEQRKYIQHNQSRMKRIPNSCDGIILMDAFTVPQWIFANSIFANILSNTHSLSIYSYGSKDRTYRMNKIFNSFGCNTHIKVKLSWKQYQRHKYLMLNLLKNVASPADLFNLTLQNIEIGVDIYESILRLGCKTVDINSFAFYRTLHNAITYFVFFDDFFKNNDVKYLLLSHDSYYNMGMIMRIAQSFSIPAYFANPTQISKSNQSYDLYDKFKNYPHYFRKLPESEAIKLKNIAKHELNGKLKGALSSNMPWQTKSAFHTKMSKTQLTQNSKLKIVVLTHCFYDNPHAYKKLNYKDFYEWMLFLGEISRNTNYDWYIKPHRDYLPGTLKILKDFIGAFPSFKLINPDTSFHQLKEEGLDFALTCYGSAGHELPLLGINVINSSYGPHIAYNFNLNPRSHEEYKTILMNLSDYIGFSAQISNDEIYEFYTVHNYIAKSNSLLFRSFTDYYQFIDSNPLSLKAYQYFNLNAIENHLRYTEVITNYLATDYQYEFETRLTSNK